MKKTIVLTAKFIALAMVLTFTNCAFLDALGDMEQATGSDISMKGPASVTATPTSNDYSGTYYMFPDNGLVLEIVNNTSHLLRQHTFKGTRNQQFRVAKQTPMDIISMDANNVHNIRNGEGPYGYAWRRWNGARQ